MTDELLPGPWEKIHRDLGVSGAKFDDRPLGTYIEGFADSIPNNSAMRYFERDISYRELNELANRLANSLSRLGIGKGDVVGIHMPNIPQYVIALIAVSKLGAAASGVSPLLAPREVVYQIEDAGIKVLLSLDRLVGTTLTGMDTLPACLSAVIVSGADDHRHPGEPEPPELSAVECLSYLELMNSASPDFRQVELAWDHVYLLQYTGGTTGRPKGAMLTVRGIMYNLRITHIYRPFETGREIVASAFPLFHVGGLTMTLAALRNGACSLVIPDARDVNHFCEQMIDCPPTRLAAVPTLYQMIVNHPLSREIDFSHLKLAMTGAAPITGDDRTRIEAMLGTNMLCEGFGMTESGPTYVVNPPDRCKPEAIGIPLPGTDVRIVDLETGTHELPYGEAGEIITASPQLMKGYLNRPEETAHALREWCGRTWMYSGDVGVMDEEGYIYLRDRAKDMLIVSGFKVFSVEVEDKLSELDVIAQSAVVGTADDQRPGSERVNLYVQLTPEARKRDPEQIRQEITEFCRANMAPYKVPKLIHLIDEIPLTAVGKIDKKILRELSRQT